MLPYDGKIFIKENDILNHNKWWTIKNYTEILKHCKRIWRKHVTNKNGSNECKYCIKRIHSPVSDQPFGHRPEVETSSNVGTQKRRAAL